MVDNFKYIGFLFGLKDTSISIFYSLSCIANIIAKFVAANLWEKHGIRSYYLNPAIRIVNLILVLVGPLLFSPLFLLTVLLARFNTGYEYILDDFICFNLYDGYVGMNLQKYFNFCYILAILTMSLLNYVFFTPKNWYVIYLIFTGLNLLNLFMFRHVVKYTKVPSKESEIV